MFEIRCYDDLGELRRIIRVAIAGQPVTPDLVSRYEAAQLGLRQSGRAAAFRRILEDVTYPTELPVYDRIVGTATGDLWVGAYQPFGDGRGLWWCLDDEGRLVGWVEFPERFTPFMFEGDIVRGVWRDDLDVEHIHTYRIEWPS